MRTSGSGRRACAVVILAALVSPAAAFAQTARSGYTEALAREDLIRNELDRPNGAPGTLLLRRIRTIVAEYETVARRYPRSGYSDNALFQAAVLSADAFWQFGEDADRRTALRLFSAIPARFPSSSLVRQIAAHTKRLDAAARTVASAPAADARPLLKSIRRESLPDALRVTLELEREAMFQDQRLDSPPRVFVDLENTRTSADLRDARLGFPDDVVRQIRVGRQQSGATRVVLDLEGAARHSVYALYNPYRIVIDFERSPAADVVAADAKPQPAKTSGEAADEPGATWTPDPATATPAAATTPVTAPSTEGSPPSAPSANLKGGFSLSRQLGLGISRVVIDAGHGGHDPGAHVKGLNEAELTLDVALRLEKLLLKVPGVEVVMTRRANVYIPLEERTAIANRSGADLFLSIHVNAARNPRVRGIETYFLNFAPNPEAEAIAARENAGSSKTMHNLPDIVRAIALNNKIDESRDFASRVQTAMHERLRKANRDARNLGVKQAPFMVLIGATMPSVLAEISFLTNRQEATLLKTASYRQAIAEALLDGISRYQKSLKTTQTVAAQ